AGLACAGVDLCRDQSRRHRVDADAVAGELLRQADRHRVDRRLRGRVPDEIARAAERRRGRGEGDDRAARAAVAGRVEMRRTAWRATSSAPVTLRSITARMRAGSASARRLARLTIPALLTRW